MNKLLTAESPLQLLPSLAMAIGLNESIVLQQIHYWLVTNPKVYEGKPWVYNSATEWQQQFPFWSVPTIRRILGNLRDAGILEVGNFNPEPQDRTFWYTINYDKLPCDQSDQTPCDQVDHIPVDHLINLITSSDQSDQMQVINSITSYSRTETNTETNNREGVEDLDEINAAAESPEAEPDPPPAPQPSPHRIDLGSYNNFDGPRATKGIPKLERTASVSRHRVRQYRDSEHLYNPRKLKSSRVPTGEGETACEILFEFVPYDPQRISPTTLDLVDREVTDLAKWRQVLAQVDGRGWQIYNIADRLDVYKNGFKHEGNGNGHQNSSNRNGSGTGKRPAWADYQGGEYDEEWANELNGFTH